MKKLFLIATGVMIITAIAFTVATPAKAQSKSWSGRYEYAMIKYDGPDRVQYLTPEKTDYERLFKRISLPKEAHDEEFCIMIAINTMAKDGWEPIQLHSTRVLLRRPASN